MLGWRSHSPVTVTSACACTAGQSLGALLWWHYYASYYSFVTFPWHMRSVCLSTYSDRLMGIKCNLRATFKRIKTGHPTDYKWTHLVNRVCASSKDNQCQMQKSFGPVPHGESNSGDWVKKVNNWRRGTLHLCHVLLEHSPTRKCIGKMCKWHLPSPCSPRAVRPRSREGGADCINHCAF